MMEVIVGCPVSNRAWILPKWFEHVERAFEKAQLVPSFEFVVGTSVDNTESLLQGLAGSRETRIIFEDENPQSGKNRVWNLKRYRTMVDLRNRLLEEVRERKPDFFLSLDSDILLHEDALVNLLETAERFDAVGGKCYMTPPPGRVPSYSNISRANSLIRPDTHGIIKVHVIMAMKLMGPAAYNINYVSNEHGEDIGWSLECKKVGLKLGWDGRVASKHVLEESLLDRIDKRVGF